MKRWTFLVVIAMVITTAVSQPIDTAKFRINFTPQLMSFPKMNSQAEILDTATQTVDFEYYITPQRQDVTFEPSPLEAAKLPKEVMDRLYRNYLKVGFGYPITPLAQLNIHNSDNRKVSLGLNANHYSAWAKPIGKTMKKYPYAPMSDTKTHLFFKRFYKNQTLYADLGYNHQLAHRYGIVQTDTTVNYQPFFEKEYRDSLNNSFHHAYATVGIRSNYVLEDRQLKQDVRLDYDFIRTVHKDMENHIALHSYLSYDARFLRLTGHQNYRIDINVDYINNKWGNASPLIETTDNSFQVELRPKAQFSLGEYHLSVGVGIPIIHSTLYEKAQVPIYPIAELQLGLVPKMMDLYFGIDGKTEFNTLESLLYENPFLKPNIDSLRFTKNQFAVYGGLKGNIVKKLNYHISARYELKSDMPFFFVDTTTQLYNQFDVVYSEKANVLNLRASLNWEVINTIFLNLEGRYNGYYGLTIDKPWYKPSWEVIFDGKYYHKDKFVVDVNCNLSFGRWAYHPLGGDNYYLAIMKPLLNFGVGFEYFLSPQLSAFASVNNLAGQHYAKFYDFKSFGVNALLGITYSFGKGSLKRR